MYSVRMSVVIDRELMRVPANIGIYTIFCILTVIIGCLSMIHFIMKRADEKDIITYGVVVTFKSGVDTFVDLDSYNMYIDDENLFIRDRSSKESKWYTPNEIKSIR